MSQLNREAILSKLSRMVDVLDNLKRFEDIDPNQVHAALQKALIQYPQYANES